MQLALLKQWKHQVRPDWTAWNQALAMIWLVGTPAVREAAKQMDRAFWLCGARIKSRQLRTRMRGPSSVMRWSCLGATSLTQPAANR